MEPLSEPSVWRGEPPASQAAIANLLEASGLALPDAYLDQLRVSNGGEGNLGVEPGWVSFWPAEDVVRWNKGYEVAEFVPGYFGFGTNGGGELLAFKIDVLGEWPVYMIPFTSMDVEDAIMIANSFAEFRGAVGRR